MKRGIILKSVARSFNGVDVDAAVSLVEADSAVGESKKGEVAAATYVVARVCFSTALANDNVTGNDLFSAKFLDAESLAYAVPSVAGSSLSFFMGHCERGLEIIGLV